MRRDVNTKVAIGAPRSYHFFIANFSEKLEERKVVEGEEKERRDSPGRGSRDGA